MQERIKFGVIFGGKSTEYEVSLNSAYSVLKNTDKSKYDIVKIGITREGTWYVYDGDDEKIKNNTWFDDASARRCVFSTSYGDKAVYAVKDNGFERIPVDVVFPVMHGAYSEDGRMQGLLDMSGVPYVGPGCASSAVCMDKAFAKMILNNFGIPVANCVYVDKSDVESDIDAIVNDVEASFPYPVFVKPANSGSSVGISKAHNGDELKKALVFAVGFDKKILVEEGIVGREVEVAVLGNENPIALNRGEIIPGADFYDYDDKYNNGTSKSVIPAPLKKSTWVNLKRTAEGIYKYLDCKGLSRVDFFVCGKEEKIVFNEINTLPGFTDISLYPKMAMDYGYTYGGLIDKLIELAVESQKGQ